MWVGADSEIEGSDASRHREIVNYVWLKTVGQKGKACALEPLTQVIHESQADDGSSQDKPSGMNVEAPFEANS